MSVQCGTRPVRLTGTVQEAGVGRTMDVSLLRKIVLRRTLLGQPFPTETFEQNASGFLQPFIINWKISMA